MDDDKVLEILKLISHPTRQEILRRIRSLEGETGATCTSVGEGIEISQSTFSHHISELAQSGLITANPQGRCTLLSINDGVWKEFQNKLGSAVFG